MALLGEPTEVDVAAPLAGQGLGQYVDWMGVFRVCQVRACVCVWCWLATDAPLPIGWRNTATNTLPVIYRRYLGPSSSLSHTAVCAPGL